MKLYRSVVFLQDYTLEGEERERFTKMIGDRDIEELYQYLLQWEYHEGEETANKPWGESDNIQSFDKYMGTEYVVSWNSGLGYAALTHIREENHDTITGD